MPDINVTLPDGQTVIYKGVPDSVKPEEVIARVQKEHGVMPASVEKLPDADPSLLTRGMNAVKDFGRGALNNIDTMGQSLARVAGQRFGVPGIEKLLPQGGPASVIPDRPTTGPVDAYAQKALMGAGGAMSGGGVTPMGLLSGAAAGAAGHAGSEMSGGNPIASIIASLMGGAAPSGVKAFGGLFPGSNAPALAKATLEGIDPANLDVARANLVKGQQALPGVGINLSQAMSTPSNIDDVVAAMARSPEGKNVISQLRAQPERLQVDAPLALGGVPGTKQAPQTIANRAQEAATASIEAARKARTAATSPIYNAAGELEKDVPANLVSTVQDLRTEKGTPASVIAAAKDLEAKLLNNPRVPGTEMRSPQDVHQAIKDFESGISFNRVQPPDPSEQRALTRIASALRDELGSESPLTAKADALYRSISKANVDPLKKSIIGDIAGRAGAQEDKSAPGNKLLALFGAGTQDKGNSTILFAEREMRKQDPTLFPDAVSTHLAMKLDSAMAKAGDRGENFASAVKNELSGTPAQRQGLQDMLAGVARSKGVPEETVVKGFMRFIDASTMAARRPSNVSGSQEIEAVAGQSKLAGLLTSMTPGRIGGKVAGRYSAGAKEAIDKLLTTPEGLDKLRELAKIDPSSTRAQAIIGTVLGGAAAGN